MTFFYNKENIEVLYQCARAKMEMAGFHGAVKFGLATGEKDRSAIIARKAQAKIDLYGYVIDSYRLQMEEQYTLNHVILIWGHCTQERLKFQ